MKAKSYLSTMIRNWNWKLIGAAWLFFIVLTVWVSDHAFFWDTVQLASKHAHFFYDNHFRSFTLPEEIDSGHPPLWGLYIAACWQLFGRSLEVSHFAVLPFLLGIGLQSWLLMRRLMPAKQAGWGMALLLAEPTLLAQSSLVSPDVALVFFYLLGVNAFMSGKRGWVMVATAGLGLISMRGMMSAVALFLSDVVWNVKRSEGRIATQCARLLLAYLPGAVLAASWLAWHYAATGWIGYHENSPWAGSFERVGIAGMLKNAALIGWRFLDFGLVWLWLAGGTLFLFMMKGRLRFPSQFGKLLALFLLPLICYAPNLISHSYLTGHRYLLVPMIFFVVCMAVMVSMITHARLRMAVTVLLLGGLATGHLWRYPEGVAMGWDSTLGHLPYYELRRDMMQYMQEQQIAISDAGSSFPNLGTLRETDLSEDSTHFHEKNLETDTWVFYSNVYNGFSDEELALLRDSFLVEKEMVRYPVRVVLYKRK